MVHAPANSHLKFRMGWEDAVAKALDADKPGLGGAFLKAIAAASRAAMGVGEQEPDEQLKQRVSKELHAAWGARVRRMLKAKELAPRTNTRI